MSKVFRDISSIDAMPSHVEAPSRICGHTVGKATFRSGLAAQDRERLNFQFGTSNYTDNLPDLSSQPSPIQHAALMLQSKSNQDLRTGTLVPRSAVPGTFGLQARNLPPSHMESSVNHQDTRGVHHKSAMSAVSRTFGLISGELNSRNAQNPQNTEISNSDLRRSGSVNASLMPRTFGHQSRNLTLHSRFVLENDLRGNPDLDFMNCRRSNLSTVSRTFDLGAERVGGGIGLSAHNNEGFIRDLRRNGSVNSSLTAKPFGHHSRNLTVHSNLLAEGNSNCRMNSLSTGFKGIGSGVRSGTLIAESRVQEGGTCNDEIFDNGGFRRPTLSRVIRGRNSLLSSRLFHNQNVERHCRDLSNINGFNVSHIGRRDVDSLSESRMGLNLRSNWMDNQSIGGSFLSAASMKGQFMNLLENLHHSILNIGPHFTAEAVRMEFDKAKQGLENICEMSLAPSVREADAASVISQSSKYICAPASESAADAIIDGGSLHLKSSKEVLKALISSKDSNGNKVNLATRGEERVRGKLAPRTSSEDSDDSQVTEFLFKKPKQLPKRKKTSRSANIKATGTAEASKATSKAFSLKQWYPMAIGSDLALCGLDEQGVAVQTDPVKKRLNGRRVELVSGLVCNLIGSPSPTVSVLPKKVAALLKNGLTERWRVLQRELANCQTAEKKYAKGRSKSPKVGRSPQKAAAEVGKAGRGTGTKVKGERSKVKSVGASGRKSKSPKVLVSPKRSGKGAEVLTRSGRTVKPPAMFWLVGGINGMSSSRTLAMPKTTSRGRSPKKEYKGSSEGTPASVESPKKRHGKGEEFGGEKANQQRRSLEGKSRKAEKASPSERVEGKASKVGSPKGNKKKEGEEDTLRVDSCTEDAKRRVRGNKRKREVNGDADAAETKKSKLEKLEVEVESRVEDTDSVEKKGRKKKGGVGLGARATKAKRKKSPAKKSNGKSKKKAPRETESEDKKEQKEQKELNEFEEDFELQLDDIEIPEIANVSGNPRLSRSQLRIVSMETPPLKYFNSNLRLLRSATPMRSPDWCISQRSESEVKRFQKRREEAFKKKTRVDVKQTIVTEKTTKSVQSKELKRVMEWIAEKTVKSPAWNSRVVQYFIPSRKQLEQQDDDEQEEDEGGET